MDSLDLSAFHARYAKGGPRNQPFHPAMMVKVLIYGYATGTFSSCKLAAKLFDDVALRVLAAENYPAHHTLSDFRALHLQEFAVLFLQVVHLARECGLVKLGAVAMNGTKLMANASRHKAMSYERKVKAEVELKGQIDGLLNGAQAADDLEKYDPDTDIEARSSAEPTGWPRSLRPSCAWNNSSKKPMPLGGAPKTTSASPGTSMANLRAGATSVTSVFPKTTPRRASPTRIVES